MLLIYERQRKIYFIPHRYSCQRHYTKINNCYLNPGFYGKKISCHIIEDNIIIVGVQINKILLVRNMMQIIGMPFFFMINLIKNSILVSVILQSKIKTHRYEKNDSHLFFSFFFSRVFCL